MIARSAAERLPRRLPILRSVGDGYRKGTTGATGSGWVAARAKAASNPVVTSSSRSGNRGT